VLSSSLVVLAGGTHFHDDYPRWRRYRHYRYLTRFLAILAVARLGRRPVIALGQGVGPLGHFGGRALARALMWLVPAGTVRDDASLRCAQFVGAGREWQRTCDTAAAAPERWCDPDLPRRNIAVAPVFGAEPGLWTACVAAISATWDTVDARGVTVLGFRGGDREDDAQVVTEVSRSLAMAVPTEGIVFDDDLVSLTEALGQASIVLCARYHALVLALLAGAVPIVLPAHRKLCDTAELVGLPPQLVVREASVEAIAHALRAAREIDARKFRPVLEDLRANLEHDGALLARFGGSE
jgi:polysaccharide pyruvyl transferase WcaK-like protein